MKKIGLLLLATVIVAVVITGLKLKKPGMDATGPGMKDGILIVNDFNEGVSDSNLLGAWNKDPLDKTQGCSMEYAEPGFDGTGKCLKISYDVDSPNPAYNGFYLKLNGLDARRAGKISFWIKGDEKAYPKKFKMEVKNANEASPYYIVTATGEWQEIEIPLTEFPLITDWSSMQEFVLVFEDMQTKPKTGAIYLDTISFKQ